MVVCWFMCLWRWVEFDMVPSTSESKRGENEDSKEESKGKEKRLRFNKKSVLNGAKEVLETTFVRVFESSPNTKRTFCGRCGTNLTFFHDSKEEIDEEDDERKVDIAFGSLDPEFLEWEALRPVMKGWEPSGITWVRKLLEEGEKSLYES